MATVGVKGLNFCTLEINRQEAELLPTIRRILKQNTLRGIPWTSFRCSNFPLSDIWFEVHFIHIKSLSGSPGNSEKNG